MADQVTGERVRPFSAEGAIRQWHDGTFWFLNQRSKGWTSFGFHYPSLEAIAEHWAIRIGAEREDEHGPYWPYEIVATPRSQAADDDLPAIEPLTHVRLTPGFSAAETGHWWVLEVPPVEGQTAEQRIMLCERHVIDLLVTFGRAVFDGDDAEPLFAAWSLADMSLLSDTDAETIQALRTLLVERASGDGGR